MQSARAIYLAIVLAVVLAVWGAQAAPTGLQNTVK